MTTFFIDTPLAPPLIFLYNLHCLRGKTGGVRAGESSLSLKFEFLRGIRRGMLRVESRLFCLLRERSSICDSEWLLDIRVNEFNFCARVLEGTPWPQLDRTDSRVCNDRDKYSHCVSNNL
jgi:hypothetical protein